MPGSDQIRVLLQQVQHMITSSNKRSHDLVSQSGDDGGATNTTPYKEANQAHPSAKQQQLWDQQQVNMIL